MQTPSSSSLSHANSHTHTHTERSSKLSARLSRDICEQTPFWNRCTRTYTNPILESPKNATMMKNQLQTPRHRERERKTHTHTHEHTWTQTHGHNLSSSNTMNESNLKKKKDQPSKLQEIMEKKPSEQTHASFANMHNQCSLVPTVGRTRFLAKLLASLT